MNPITIVILVAVLLVAGYFIYTSKKPAYHILETRTFSCPGMEGFTFKYPVFKGWEVVSTQDTSEFAGGPRSCEILLSDASRGRPKAAAELRPRIIVRQDQPHVAMQENPHGIRYEELDEDKYFFNLASFSVEVELVNVNESFGFSKREFWKQVIESFRINEEPLDGAIRAIRTREDTQFQSDIAATLKVEQRATEVIQILKRREFPKLAAYIHPDKGVRFSPYGHINLTEDLFFHAIRILNLSGDETKWKWGTYDGSGLPIELTFDEYYERFIYDKDFMKAPNVEFNQIIGRGNTASNIPEAYPDGKFVEYHFPGFDPKAEGADWESLSLVFEEKDGIWYLVGIIHAQWTI